MPTLTSEQIVEALYGATKIFAAENLPAGLTVEEYVVSLTSDLYKLVNVQNVNDAIAGVKEFGAEHGATFVAFELNNGDFDDRAYLLGHPITFYNDQGTDLSARVDSQDHENDPRISAWIDADRDLWIIDEITPGTGSNAAQDGETAALSARLKQPYTYRCATA
jgi:hypothetical protein